MKKMFLVIFVILTITLVSGCGSRVQTSELSGDESLLLIQKLNAGIAAANSNDLEVTIAKNGSSKNYRFFRERNIYEHYAGNIHRFITDDYHYLYDEGINAYKIGIDSVYWYGYEKTECTFLPVKPEDVTMIKKSKSKASEVYTVNFVNTTEQRSNPGSFSFCLEVSFTTDGGMSLYRQIETLTDGAVPTITEYNFTKIGGVNFCLPENYTDFFEIKSESEVFVRDSFTFSYNATLIFDFESWCSVSNHIVYEDMLFITNSQRFMAYDLSAHELKIYMFLPLEATPVFTDRNTAYFSGSNYIVTVDLSSSAADIFVVPSTQSSVAGNADNIYYLDNSKRDLYVVNKTDKSVALVHTLPSTASDLTINTAGDTIYVCFSNGLAAYSLTDFSQKFFINGTAEYVSYSAYALFYNGKKYSDAGVFIENFPTYSDQFYKGQKIASDMDRLTIDNQPYRRYDIPLTLSAEYTSRGGIGGFYSNPAIYKNKAYLYVNNQGFYSFDFDTMEKTFITKEIGYSPYYSPYIVANDKVVWKSQNIIKTYDINTELVSEYTAITEGTGTLEKIFYPEGISDILYYSSGNDLYKMTLSTKQCVKYFTSASGSPEVAFDRIYTAGSAKCNYYSLSTCDYIGTFDLLANSYVRIFDELITDGKYIYSPDGALLCQPPMIDGNIYRGISYCVGKFVITGFGVFDTEKGIYVQRVDDEDVYVGHGDTIICVAYSYFTIMTY